MKFLSPFLSVLLLGFVCEAMADDSNPCDGELFSSVCQILRVMKKDIDSSKKQLEGRLNNIKGMCLNHTRESKMEIERVENELAKKQASDIKKVTEMMEEKMRILSHLLKGKIDETKKELDNKTDNILRSTTNDVTKFKMDVLKRIQKIGKLETEIEVNKNTLTHKLQKDVVMIKKEVNSKYTTVKRECSNNLAAVKRALMQHIQQNSQQLQDLKTKYEQVKTAKWPAGRYCILANGPCPAGFTLASGHMKAISMYAGSAAYIRQANFGSSSIRCHGRCGQYGHWIGELHLSTCCK